MPMIATRAMVARSPTMPSFWVLENPSSTILTLSPDHLKNPERDCVTRQFDAIVCIFSSGYFYLIKIFKIKIKFL